MSGFPVFLELGASNPLVVGGTDIAVAKIRLLAKWATRVSVSLESVPPALHDLVAAGSVEIVGTEIGKADICGRPVVIAATGELARDQQIAALARSLGIPVNVPDRPDLSTFSMCAIVDRRPVTVAISTDGAAPVLATEIRRRLEQDLHPRLGRVAAIARGFRTAAKAIPAGPARRAFWQSVVSGPAADLILQGDEVGGRDAIEALLNDGVRAGGPGGKVILVGAGPGDPELLTLKAVRALKLADVVLHDGLMGEGVLDYARREAQFISVAKAKGKHSKTQAEINALMVSFAREGKCVVRLKGGDPSVFGRAGEEIDMLRSSGIEVEVVPGVTAATAAAASLQIPLTHRDISRSVIFISGHAAKNGLPEFDQAEFQSLAGRGATLAVYMGLSTAHVLAERLLEAGWSPATPVMAVSRVTQQGERRVSTTIDVLAERRGGLGMSGPVLLLVGEVAGLDAAGEVLRISQDSHVQEEAAVA